MKNLLIILILITCCSFNFQNEKPLKKFTIGKFSYYINKKSNYSQDDNWNAVFFTVYKYGKHQRLCSAYMVAKRNDSTFIKGNYLIFNDKLEFNELYFHRKNALSIDSIKKIFYPKKNGDLYLKKTIEFKNGKASITINK